jgi:HD-GYP domain-containing protein (c-di-GMP phosphodiesterase class II)
VLNKPGRFNEEELKIMRTHPVVGADILAKIEGIEEVCAIVRSHHERFDGGGYPDGLKGEDIPKASRILGIADTLDAITTNRAYRKKRDVSAAVAELTRCSGTQFDPEVVKACQKALDAGIGPFSEFRKDE